MAEKLKNKIAFNVSTDDNFDGLLRHAYSEYAECMQVDVDTFRKLIEDDVDIWESGLSQTETESSRITDSTVKFLE